MMKKFLILLMAILFVGIFSFSCEKSETTNIVSPDMNAPESFQKPGGDYWHFREIEPDSPSEFKIEVKNFCLAYDTYWIICIEEIGNGISMTYLTPASNHYWLDTSSINVHTPMILPWELDTPFWKDHLDTYPAYHDVNIAVGVYFWYPGTELWWLAESGSQGYPGLRIDRVILNNLRVFLTTGGGDEEAEEYELTFSVIFHRAYGLSELQLFFYNNGEWQPAIQAKESNVGYGSFNLVYFKENITSELNEYISKKPAFIRFAMRGIDDNETIYIHEEELYVLAFK